MQKSKKNISAAELENNKYSPSRCPSNNENNKNNEKIILKNPANNNILVPNNFYLKNNNNSLQKTNNVKSEYNNNQNSESFKLGSFLESKQSPDYLRNYDTENLKNIELLLVLLDL